MNNYCSVTGELREWAKKLTHWWYDPVKNECVYTTNTMPPSIDTIRLDERLVAIADRIDTEHERLMAERRRSCVFYDAERNYCSVHDEGDMVGLGYARLPVDADGKYWHIGDKAKSVRFPEHVARTVCGFGTLNGKPVLFYKSDGGGHSSNPHQGWDYAESVRRCDCDTWEDIIEAAYIRGAKDQWVNHDKRVTSYSFLNGCDLVDRCKAIAARGGGE